jgi:hypothetical protein
VSTWSPLLTAARQPIDLKSVITRASQQMV